MVKRCFFCRREFPSNSVLEHFPNARQLAYDPQRGRLWALCEGCGQWTLAPFEARWEALEELERKLNAFVVLARTDNIALLRGQDVKIVRIGAARLREQAWWRYGRRLARRRRNLSMALKVSGAVLLVPTALTLGLGALPLVIGSVPYVGVLWTMAPHAIRTAKFGWFGWRGPTQCLRCGTERRALSYSSMRQLRVVSGKRAGDLGARLPCPSCGKNGLQFNAGEAELLLRRYLAYRYMFGATQNAVTQAASEVESAGSSAAVLSRAARGRAVLSGMSAGQLLAFEIAINDETEKALLQLRVAELEVRWREAEEIAAIADGELTSIPSSTGPMSTSSITGR